MLASNREQEIVVTDPTTREERFQVAQACAVRLEIRMPVLIDQIDNETARQYGGWPDRLYLIGTDGRVVFQGDEGPSGFEPAELERAIRPPWPPSSLPRVIGVDAESFLVIVSAAALAAIISALVSPRLVLPVVVVELFLGIAIGPQGADLAHVDNATNFSRISGWGCSFFFAGYEIDFERINGTAARARAGGWLVSLALAYGLAGILVAGNVVDSDLYTGSAMATTAIGTLIPILHEAANSERGSARSCSAPGRWASSGRSCSSRSC